MKARKLLSRKPPVIYRWVRRRRFFPYAVLLCCVFLVLPAGVVGGVKMSGLLASGRALAAVPAPGAVDDSAPDNVHPPSVLELGRSIVADPSAVLALSGADILSLFSDPDLKRQDGATQVWQYRAEACVLDLYMDGAGDTVLYREVRPRMRAALQSADRDDLPDISESECLSVLGRRGGKS